ncbi:THUMP domain-containing protein 1 [Glycine soja]|nr:THUMP domain-containing protein 1 [Glycine soja]
MPAPDAAAANGKKRRRYLPHNKAVKKKGSYPLRPGVQGFFITCDGGREHQASREALNILDSFYEELVDGEKELPSKPLNKKITDDNASHDDGAGEKSDPHNVDEPHTQEENKTCDNKGDNGNLKTTKGTADDLPSVKQCCKTNVPACNFSDKVEHKSIDKLIEEEFKELGDKNKRRFAKLDSGCNGVVFVQMRKKDGDRSPKDIVHRIVTSAASTGKHMSSLMLCFKGGNFKNNQASCGTVLSCGNSKSTQVLYEARANTGVDRMEIIDAVAKSVPGPHKVDLKNPDKTIVVEIARFDIELTNASSSCFAWQTVCLIGVIEKYKELSKYNLRQLTSRKD